MKKNINLSANGKLLLTGEYLVLVGAEALSFPIRLGQTLIIEHYDQPFIQWVSKEKGIAWFTCNLEPLSLEIISASDYHIAVRLVDLLNSAKKLNPLFLSHNRGVSISVEANYPLNWGLGSSSSLIALIAQWAEIDPMVFFRTVSIGSGYDVACATRKEIFFYQVSEGHSVCRMATPGKAIRENTCFAYLGKKQETATEVSAFLSGNNFKRADIDRISELSHQICKADDSLILCSLVDEHEEILSRILKKERIAQHFPVFPGSVKSLGAWGGDFAMFVSEKENEEIKTWLRQAGFADVFTFNELKVSV